MVHQLAQDLTSVLTSRLSGTDPANFLQARFWITSGWPTIRPEPRLLLPKNRFELSGYVRDSLVRNGVPFRDGTLR